MLRLATARVARQLARRAAPAFNAGATRSYAEGGDIVKDVFLEQQKQFRALLDATKDLEVPVGGDRAAIKAYAEQRKAIMAKVRARTDPRLDARDAPARAGTGRPSASRRPFQSPRARDCLLRRGSSLGFFSPALDAGAKARIASRETRGDPRAESASAVTSPPRAARVEPAPRARPFAHARRPREGAIAIATPRIGTDAYARSIRRSPASASRRGPLTLPPPLLPPPPRASFPNQLGIMTTEERIAATLQSGMEAGISAREYLAFAEGQRVAMGVSDEAGLLKALQEACAEIEKASGKTLMTNDAAGMKQLYGKVEGTIAGMGLDGDVATESMVDEAEYEVGKLAKALGTLK